jgi:tetratricopeptide (TPR) repeat protein
VTGDGVASGSAGPGFSSGIPPARALPVSRRSLHLALDRGVARPLVTITAAHGYGKTSALAAWARSRGTAWLRIDPAAREPSVLGAGLLAALTGTRDRERWLGRSDVATVVERVARSVDSTSIVVLDDADVLRGSPALEVLRALVSMPGGRLRLVIASRAGLGLVDGRSRDRGRDLRLDAAHLAFDSEGVAQVLGTDAEVSPELVAAVMAATGGWPAGVDAAGEALRGVPEPARLEAAKRLTASDSTVVSAARTVLLAEEAPATRRMLGEVALLGGTDPLQLAAIRRDSVANATLVLEDLVRRGLARPATGRPSYLGIHEVELTPIVRRAVLDDLATDDARVAAGREAGRLVTEVADRLVAIGRLGKALQALSASGAGEPIAALLEVHGDELLRTGDHEAIARAAGKVPPDARSRTLERVHGDALQAAGAWDAALARFRTLAVGSGALELEVALRLGRLHHLRGELRDALTTFQRAVLPEGPDPAAIELRSWWATAHWLRGEWDQAVGRIAIAEEHARLDGGCRGLAFVATVRTFLATSDGDAAAYERHHRAAFSAADRAGDTEQLARIRVNRGSRHLAQGRYTEALFESERALGLVTSATANTVAAIGRCNRAEVLLRTGRIDEAETDALTALAELERLGARAASYALNLLGDVSRERGELRRAASRYRRALQVTGGDEDHQAVLPATIGLVRTLAVTDPEQARALAATIPGLPGGADSAGAWLACAWAALARDEPDVAAAHADRARDLATVRADRRGDAEAATVLALTEADPVPGLRDAARRWHRLHDPVWASRTELGLARRSHDLHERSRAGDLEVRLARLGCAVRGGEVGHRRLCSSPAVPLRIRAFGELSVERGGTRRDLGTSGPARRVLAALIVHAGRSISWEELARLVWPGERFADAVGRLGAAVDEVRQVLRENAADAVPLVGGATALRLRVESMDLDVHGFERSADRGLRAARAGRPREAVVLLRTARELHRGELLAGEPGTPWAESKRVEVRARLATVEQALGRLEAVVAPDGDDPLT